MAPKQKRKITREVPDHIMSRIYGRKNVFFRMLCKKTGVEFRLISDQEKSAEVCELTGSSEAVSVSLKILQLSSSGDTGDMGSISLDTLRRTANEEIRKNRQTLGKSLSDKPCNNGDEVSSASLSVKRERQSNILCVNSSDNIHLISDSKSIRILPEVISNQDFEKVEKSATWSNIDQVISQTSVSELTSTRSDGSPSAYGDSLIASTSKEKTEIEVPVSNMQSSHPVTDDAFCRENYTSGSTPDQMLHPSSKKQKSSAETDQTCNKLSTPEKRKSSGKQYFSPKYGVVLKEANVDIASTDHLKILRQCVSKDKDSVQNESADSKCHVYIPTTNADQTKRQLAYFDVYQIGNPADIPPSMDEPDSNFAVCNQQTSAYMDMPYSFDCNVTLDKGDTGLPFSKDINKLTANAITMAGLQLEQTIFMKNENSPSHLPSVLQTKDQPCEASCKKSTPCKEKNLNCSDCDFITNSKTLLEFHRKRRHYPKSHVCKICNSMFGLVKDLRKHMKMHQEEHVCGVCGRRSRDRRAIQRHIIKHQRIIKLKCSRCSAEFTSKGSLTNHIHFRHGPASARIQPLRCNLCSAEFTRRLELRRHMDKHNDIKPHLCSICGRRFRLRVSLRRHMDTHSKEPKYSCQYCGKLFKQKHNVEIHERIHQRPAFKCDQCGRSFTQKQSLQRHENTHSGVRPYVCAICLTCFTDTSTTRRHLIMIHGIMDKQVRQKLILNLFSEPELLRQSKDDANVANKSAPLVDESWKILNDLLDKESSEDNKLPLDVCAFEEIKRKVEAKLVFQAQSSSEQIHVQSNVDDETPVVCPLSSSEPQDMVSESISGVPTDLEEAEGMAAQSLSEPPSCGNSLDEPGADNSTPLPDPQETIRVDPSTESQQKNVVTIMNKPADSDQPVLQVKRNWRRDEDVSALMKEYTAAEILTPSGLRVYECKLCAFRYTNLETMVRHAASVHKSLAKKALVKIDEATEKTINICERKEKQVRIQHSSSACPIYKKHNIERGKTHISLQQSLPKLSFEDAELLKNMPIPIQKRVVEPRKSQRLPSTGRKKLKSSSTVSANIPMKLSAKPTSQNPVFNRIEDLSSKAVVLMGGNRIGETNAQDAIYIMNMDELDTQSDPMGQMNVTDDLEVSAQPGSILHGLLSERLENCVTDVGFNEEANPVNKIPYPPLYEQSQEEYPAVKLEEGNTIMVDNLALAEAFDQANIGDTIQVYVTSSTEQI